jgi:endonuclease/exonuclease/phosphatase (EEP) superfamily protein YafD
MIIATLLPLIPRDEWWIRGFDFPRLQITAVIVATLTALQLTDANSLGGEILIVVLFLCLFYQIYMISPYTILAKQQVQQSEYDESVTSFSILCANVQMNNRQSSKLKQIFRESDPDIILALEPDEWWLNELEEFEQ